MLPRRGWRVGGQRAEAACGVRGHESRPRGVLVRRGDLERHGFTAGGRRCSLVREGRKSQGVKHGDECRLRVKQAMRDAENPRLHRSEGRALGELERRAALPAPEAAEAPEAEALAAPEAPATPIAHDDDADDDTEDARDPMLRVHPAAVADLASPSRARPTPPRPTAADP